MAYRRAKQLALEAIRTADLMDIEELNTIKNQKKQTKAAATKEWARRWHQSPHDSLAYQTALTEPPDGHPHPTFHIGKNNAKGKRAKFSRLTHATLYRFTTGHAFIGAYTQRFHPQHTLEQVACPCGEPTQTVEHVLLHCPHYMPSRRKHLTANGRPHGLSSLFTQTEHVEGLLRFLEETGACIKTRTTWEPR